MAIEKAIETSVGPQANYHRIATARISFAASVAVAVVASFWNHEARASGKGAMGHTEHTMQAEQFPLTADHESALKKLFDISESQRIIAIDATFDKDVAYCRVVAEKTVLGKRGQWEEQHQLPKNDMPVDILALMYPIVQPALFPDSKEV